MPPEVRHTPTVTWPLRYIGRRRPAELHSVSAPGPTGSSTRLLPALLLPSPRYSHEDLDLGARLQKESVQDEILRNQSVQPPARDLSSTSSLTASMSKAGESPWQASTTTFD
ncbi:unnamed protein product [Pleuronectes platessa]|uniref:Uncharacterized protein n=1 Tax=Pleuronectes platessa TaxID=8262 RepID=A0A9N7Y528_PLEPL|nr:unnamed protein product [Pleuronectes platessa]